MLATELWNDSVEKQFFQHFLKKKNSLSPKKLFYLINDKYLAYIPKNVSSPGYTLQSRNSLIGKFTEKWCQQLLSPVARKLNLYAVPSVICQEAGLSKQSSADIAFCKSDKQYQRYQDIKIIFEIKMSLLSNYEFDTNKKTVQWIGDYTTHKGNPSLLRSDSMLKAIGKLISIRVANPNTKNIPLVVLGNSSITKHYEKKVDSLKNLGIIQGFLSLNPSLSQKRGIIRNTPKKGFQTIENTKDLEEFFGGLIHSRMIYFSAMTVKSKLGQIISKSNREKNRERKAEKFLKLIEEEVL